MVVSFSNHAKFGRADPRSGAYPENELTPQQTGQNISPFLARLFYAVTPASASA